MSLFARPITFVTSVRTARALTSVARGRSRVLQNPWRASSRRRSSMTWTSKVRRIPFGLRLGRAERCVDQEWLEVVNAERKSQQLDKVSYETFEIIMDRLEKEWFDLVRPCPECCEKFREYLPSPRTYPRLTWGCPQRSPAVRYATTLRERTPMRLSSVTGATWLFTKVRARLFVRAWGLYAYCSRLLRRAVHPGGTMAL